LSDDYYVNSDMLLLAALMMVSLNQKASELLEHVMMTVVMTPHVVGVRSSFNGLQIEQVDVPIAGRSIQQCINEMLALGWKLGVSSVSPDSQGTICRFNFNRPRYMPNRIGDALMTVCRPTLI
jgi:hypothetical protein